MDILYAVTCKYIKDVAASLPRTQSRNKSVYQRRAYRKHNHSTQFRVAR